MTHPADSISVCDPERRGGVTPQSQQSHHLSRNKLGVWAIAFFVIASVAPLGGVIGGAPLVFSAGGMASPATYLLVGILYAVFAVGYLAMSRHITSASGFVSYVSYAVGARAATAVAGVALLAYMSIICGLWSFMGEITHYVLKESLGIAIPASVFIALFLTIITALAYRGIDVSLRVMGFLLILEMSVLIVLIVAILINGGPDGINFKAFSGEGLLKPGMGIAFLFAATCFTGFEATVVFAEEAREPERTIPRAAYVAIAVIGGFYALSTWAIGLGYGASEAQAAAQKDIAGFVFALGAKYVGSWYVSLLNVLLVTSLMAMFLSFHNIVARYIFALSRAGFLPDKFDLVNGKSGVPERAVLVSSGLVVLVLSFALLAGIDFMTVVYPWLVGLGTVSIVTVLIATSMSVLVFFARNTIDSRLWNTRIAPLLASIGLLAIAYLAISNYDALVGGDGSQAIRLLAAIPLVALLGWVVSTRRLSSGRKIDFQTIPA